MGKVGGSLFGIVLLIACSSDESAPGPTSSSSSGASSGTASSSGGSSSGDPPGTDGGTTVGQGIASRHPGDVGIGEDPDVIFFDDFESYAAEDDLWKRWDNTFQQSQTRIATEPANVKAGAKSLEFSLPQQDQELSNAVQKILTTELDVLYLRWYSKFEATFDVTGSSHNGGGISAHYFQGNNATPGVPANGTNKFLVELECWRGEETDQTPGLLNVYVYHPEQRDDYGDHFFPSGLVMPNTSLAYDFGAGFTKRPEMTPELGRWYAYEVMVKANTPGSRDGRITAWVDGNVFADWTNLRLRDVDTLKIDRFNLSLHSGSNTKGPTKKWYDNVVAAKSYVGPMVP
jgi:hypothetical protein